MSLKRILLENQTDRILDKINRGGMDSLSSYEKEILQGTFTGDIDKDVAKMLEPYKNLDQVEEKDSFFGKESKVKVYFDDDEYFKYNIDKNELVVNYNVVMDPMYKLFEGIYKNNEINKAIAKWFGDVYGERNIRSVTYWFEGL